MNLATKKKGEEDHPNLFEEALKKVPPEQLKEAQKRVDDLLKGDLSWTELFALPPDKLKQMGEVGYGQFKAGRYESAEKIFKGLTVLDPENYYYHQILGATYQRQGKFPEAVLEYSVAVDLNPQDLVSMTNRGESYMKLGLHPLAVKDLERVIEMDNSGQDKWANRARLLKEQMKLMGDKKPKKV